MWPSTQAAPRFTTCADQRQLFLSTNIMAMRSYIVPAALLALLLALQAQLWFGRGSVQSVDALKAKLEQLEADNAAMRLANEQLASEVRDLQEGLEVVEAYARQELGMVKANEIFVQYAKPAPSAAQTTSP